jgi:hypothetical protein
MSRPPNQRNVGRLVRRLIAGLAVSMVTAGVATALPGAAASALVITPTSSSWCTGHGAATGGWTATKPALPICGPGPAYGGTWQYVNLPGPFGALDGYFNATPGFQCVELAERYLAVVDGLAPVEANGAQVAMAYHAAYPQTRLFVNGSASAVGHAPVSGDVISLSGYSGFVGTDGHVAIVTGSHVNGAGNGTVTIAQQNVSASEYIYTLGVASWHLYDPQEPSNALFQFHYAEWLAVPHPQSRAGLGSIRLVDTVSNQPTVLVPHGGRLAASSRIRTIDRARAARRSSHVARHNGSHAVAHRSTRRRGQRRVLSRRPLRST